MPNDGLTLNYKENMLVDNDLAFNVLPSLLCVLHNIPAKRAVVRVGFDLHYSSL